MSDVFAIVERRAETLDRPDAIAAVIREKRLLESRVVELEAGLEEERAERRRLAETLKALDASIQDVFSRLADNIDEIDDLIHVEQRRFADADPSEPHLRLSLRWRRRYARTRARLLDTLSANGVTIHDPIGAARNPGREIVHGSETSATRSDGEIVRVLRTGLIWRDTVLRHAVVTIADRSEQAADNAAATVDVVDPQV